MVNPAKKILLIQLFSNGDCLYATAVARQIKNDFPGCHLTWAIADFCKDIINNNPYVDEVRIVKDVPKNDVRAFRRFKKLIRNEKEAGKWDEVFDTTPRDKNQANYDGTIRGMIFRSYPRMITVPVQPVLRLFDEEVQRVQNFVSKFEINKFKNVILWEFAPQSGQVLLSFEKVYAIATKLTMIESTCVILSSPHSFPTSKSIVDASSLTFRENAALTHYCNLLIGCSSGITWINTSSAAKMLPGIQILNPNADFINIPSHDFKRFGLEVEKIIELDSFDETHLIECVKAVYDTGFEPARKKYHCEMKNDFRTSSKIVYNLLCYLQFKEISRHYKILKSIYGNDLTFVKRIIGAIVLFPFKLIRNRVRKNFALL